MIDWAKYEIGELCLFEFDDLKIFSFIRGYYIYFTKVQWRNVREIERNIDRDRYR